MYDVFVIGQHGQICSVSLWFESIWSHLFIMKTLHGKPIKFCRWGGLSPVKQKGYNRDMPTFHSPPCRKGFYAFLWPYIDLFLLGSNDVFKNNHKWTGKITYTKESFLGEEYDLEHVALQKPRIFKHHGYIWHHLGKHLNRKDIKKKRGSWVKTSYHKYCLAVKKELHEMRKSRCIWWGNLKGFPNNPATGYGVDHLEVFIERIK